VHTGVYNLGRDNGHRLLPRGKNRSLEGGSQEAEDLGEYTREEGSGRQEGHEEATPRQEMILELSNVLRGSKDLGTMHWRLMASPAGKSGGEKRGGCPPLVEGSLRGEGKKGGRSAKIRALFARKKGRGEDSLLYG